MFTWRGTKWRYKSLAISFAANALVAASVPVLGFFSVWLLIPGASVAFWFCNLFDPGCKGGHENAAWAVGWVMNTIFGWGLIWAMGAFRAGRKLGN